MPDTAARVRFDSVEKTFGDVRALHPLTLDVEPGSLFALLGPSGCGKTTTLRLIAGFEQPSGGSIHIGDRDVTGHPAHKRNFGMVFQNFALFPHLTVNQNVSFGLEMRKVTRREIGPRVRRALELVDLESYGDRYPRELSGGQQQRVALARAIVFEPDVLLLDEPLSALDKMLRDQMQIEIRELQQRLGMTTVFVTHDQEEALTMADRIAVMRDGSLLQTGSPREIYERPGSRFVATFLGSSNLIRVQTRGRDATGLKVELDGHIFTTSGPGSLSSNSGEEITVSLRPERIRLDPTSVLRAKLSHVIFRGASCQLQLELATQSIKAIVPGEAAQGLEPGQDVGLAWSEDSLVALEPE